MARVPRTHQEDLEDAILDLLKDGRIWSTRDIQKAVRKKVPPTPGDLVRANMRDQESKYDGVVSNTLRKNSKLCRDSLIKRTDDGNFCITLPGRDFLELNAHRDLEVDAVFNSLYPNGLV